MDEEQVSVSVRTRVEVVGGKCGRWNPTMEQVKVLTDLFRSGLRTPSTDQIQKISTYLSFYGKIESKNVFYWFQNHKARERHHKKRRRGDNNLLHLHTPDKREARTSRITDGTEVMWEWEREIETLELFPLNSSDSEVEKVRAVRSERKETRFSVGKDSSVYLCLSFI